MLALERLYYIAINFTDNVQVWVVEAVKELPLIEYDKVVSGNSIAAAESIANWNVFVVKAHCDPHEEGEFFGKSKIGILLYKFHTHCNKTKLGLTNVVPTAGDTITGEEGEEAIQSWKLEYN